LKLLEVAPTALIARAILVRGGAFRAEYECLDEGKKQRFFFVANLNPENDSKIMLFTATTQIERRRKHHGNRADIVLVPLDPMTYPDIKQACVIDCESPIKRTREEFNRGVHAREYAPLGALPSTVCLRIAAAVREARTLSPTEKRLIVAENHSR